MLRPIITLRFGASNLTKSSSTRQPTRYEYVLHVPPWTVNGYMKGLVLFLILSFVYYTAVVGAMQTMWIYQNAQCTAEIAQTGCMQELYLLNNQSSCDDSTVLLLPSFMLIHFSVISSSSANIKLSQLGRRRSHQIFCGWQHVMWLIEQALHLIIRPALFENCNSTIRGCRQTIQKPVNMLSVEYFSCCLLWPVLWCCLHSVSFFVFPDSASMPYTVGTTVKRAQVRKFIHDLAGYWSYFDPLIYYVTVSDWIHFLSITCSVYSYQHCSVASFVAALLPFFVFTEWSRQHSFNPY